MLERHTPGRVVITKSAIPAKKAARTPLASNMFEAALAEVRAMRRGEVKPRVHQVFVPPDVDVREIRARLGLTQEDFAARYGFSLSAVRKWERDARQPEPAARTLLAMIARHPKTISKMIAEVAG